jgi:hypothetical protein
MHCLALIALSLALLGGLSGCETIPVVPEPPPDPPDQSGCAAAAADRVLTDGKDQALAIDGSYGQRGCPHSFVVDNIGVRTPDYGPQLVVKTSLPSPRNEAACDAAWLKASLWRKQGSTFVKLDEQERHGGAWEWVPGWKGSPGGYDCRAPQVDFVFHEAGTYRVAASAAAPSGFTQLDVQFSDTFNPPCPQGDGVGASCTVEYSVCAETYPGHYRCRGNFSECVPDVPVCMAEACDGQCGDCTGVPCTADTDCAPGLICPAATGQCTQDPNCQPRAKVCWQKGAPPPSFCQ